jgi:hypothetical protein
MGIIRFLQVKKSSFSLFWCIFAIKKMSTAKMHQKRKSLSPVVPFLRQNIPKKLGFLVNVLRNGVAIGDKCSLNTLPKG